MKRDRKRDHNGALFGYCRTSQKRQKPSHLQQVCLSKKNHRIIAWNELQQRMIRWVESLGQDLSHVQSHHVNIHVDCSICHFDKYVKIKTLQLSQIKNHFDAYTLMTNMFSEGTGLRDCPSSKRTACACIGAAIKKNQSWGRSITQSCCVSCKGHRGYEGKQLWISRSSTTWKNFNIITVEEKVKDCDNPLSLWPWHSSSRKCWKYRNERDMWYPSNPFQFNNRQHEVSWERWQDSGLLDGLGIVARSSEWAPISLWLRNNFIETPMGNMNVLK